MPENKIIIDYDEYLRLKNIEIKFKVLEKIILDKNEEKDDE